MTAGAGHMQFLRQAISRALSYIFSERFQGVVTSEPHPPHLERHRLDTLVSRIRLVSMVFGALTVLWIPIDMMTLDSPDWIVLAALRLLVAGIFFGLAVLPLANLPRMGALILVAVMLANPLILHTAAHILFADMASQSLSLSGLLSGPRNEAALINANLYAALPYVVMAGLCLFPLVAVETVLLALPVFTAVMFLPAASGGAYSLVEIITTSWILGLLLGICVLAGMIQVYYMEALLRRANHDPLTGALTRRSGTELLEFFFRLANDKSAPLTVAFIDIDDFKAINDTFGHDVGDDALRQAAEVLNDGLRDADTIVRWGGEEFLLVLNETSVDGARVVFERIQARWLGERPDGGPLTASVGVAERISDAAQTWDALVKLADERMYGAKNQGKAQVVFGPALTVAAE